MLKTLSIAAAVIGFAVTMAAQTPEPADTFKVNYFSNAHTAGDPDGTVYLTDVGSSTVTGTNKGNLCAMIYVFRPDQQMAECCGCELTPDGLRTLSINGDLTSNPLTAATFTSGVIKIVSSSGYPACNPRHPVPVAGVRAWGTHIQTGGAVTETEFLDATLSAGELANLGPVCSSILLEGSGAGSCSCGTGD
jgi:hypothetical protein